MTDQAHIVPHEVHRLEVPVGLPFDELRERYERAVPLFDFDRYAALDPNHTDWATVRRLTDGDAPHGFLLYWRTEVDVVMRLAGHHNRCTSYLMGNHTIAERMYCYDPGIALYAPLRTMIHEDRDSRVWFSIDQPSTRFSSFDHPQIAAIGVELDHKVADLFTALGVTIPEALIT